MKKRIISLTLCATLVLQILSFSAVYVGAETAVQRIFQNALYDSDSFIQRLFEESKNDDFSKDMTKIDVEANSDSVNNNGDMEFLGEDSSVMLFENDIYVPVRDMAEILDYEVSWDDEERKASIQSEHKNVSISTEPDAAEDDELQGVLVDGKTYAPVDDVASVSGYQTIFSEDGNKARLTEKFLTKRLFAKLKNKDALKDNTFAQIFEKATSIAVNEEGLIFAAFSTESDTEEAFNLLEGNAYIEYVEPDSLINIELEGGYTWGVDYCNAESYASTHYVIQNNPDTITVAVIDTGLNPNDPIFQDRIIYDNTMGDCTDPHGHGTHVAGIIASMTQGVKDKIKICPYKFDVNSDGSFSTSTALNMYTLINKAAAHDVINMSFSISPITNLQTLKDSISKNNKSLFVVSAGNDGKEVDKQSLAHFVQAYFHGVGVTAIDKNGTPASFSNYVVPAPGLYETYDSYYYIAAPGVDINSTYGVGGYSHAQMSGTSQAAPHVTGACAILFLLTRTTNTPEIVKNSLFRNVCKVPEGWNKKYGRGVLDLTYSINDEHEGFKWEIKNGVLTITGSGELPRINDETSLRWPEFQPYVEKVCFLGDISGITMQKLGNPPKVKSIEISSDNTHYSLVNGTLYTKDGKTLLYCPGIEDGSEYDIPDGTTTIASAAFRGCEDLVSVIIPESVTVIEEGAFADCVNLSAIYYKGTDAQWNAILKSDGWDANAGTNSDKGKYEVTTNYDSPDYSGACGDNAVWKLWLSDGILHIEGEGAMYDYDFTYENGQSGDKTGTTAGWSPYVEYITGLEIEEGITVIGQKAFANCDNLTDIVLPDSVTTIRDNAFGRYLINLTLSKSFSTFEGDVLTQCSGLENIYVHEENNNFSSADGVLYNKDGSVLCSYPKGRDDLYFKIPDGVKKIGQNAFRGNDNIRQVLFCDGLKEIEDSAFDMCSNLKYVSLPEGFTTIGTNAFLFCYNLKEVYLPSTIKKIDRGSFGSCTGIKAFCYNGTATQWNNIQRAYDWSYTTYITVTFNSSEPTSGTFGNNFSWSFDNATGELFINGTGEMTWNTESVPWEKYKYSVKSVTISEGVTSVPDEAFAFHSQLKQITFPNTLKSLGEYVCYRCESLESVTLPEMITVVSESAFSYCENLTAVTLPKGLQEIEMFAFSNTYSLSDIYFKGSSNRWSSVTKSSTWDIYAGKNTEKGTYTVHYGEENNFTGSFGDGFTWTYWINSKVLEIGGTGAMPDWTSADQTPWYKYLNQLTVYKITSIVISEGITHIGNYAFANYTSVTSLTLPSTLTDIGSSAFTGCSLLNEVNLPEKLTTIGAGAFSGCSAILEISLPESVTTIGDSAFSSCKFKEITIPKKVTTIGAYAFYTCGKLEKVSLPESVTSIGNYAFSNCSLLNDIEFYENEEIAQSDMTIGNYVFYYCRALENIILPDNVISIGESAFSYCNILKEISLPKNLKTIGNRTFSGCSALETVNFSENLETIGGYAFQNCTSIISVTLPDSLTSIGNSAFVNCTSISSVTFPEGLASIGTCAFYDCSYLADIYYNGTNIGWKMITKDRSWDYNAGKSTEKGTYTVHYEKGYMTKGTCGENLSWEFFEDSGLLEIKGTGKMTSWTSADQVIWSDFFSKITKVQIAEGVTSIGSYAFNNCVSLTVAELPKTLTSIGYSFYKCSSLADIYYAGSGVTWAEITKSSSWDDKAGSATSAGKYVIHYAEENVYTGTFGNNLTWTYRETQKVLEISGKGAMPDYTMTSIYGAPWYKHKYYIEKIVIKEGITHIGDYSFYSFDKVTSVIIYSGCTSIGDYAFYNCNKITSLPLNEGVTTIGSYAFSGCRAITSLTIPKGVTTIGDYAFDHCTAVTSLTISKGVTTIGNYAFNNCIELTSVTIPRGCTAIGEGAFNRCTSMTSVTIADSVQSIGKGAFGSCNILRDIYYSDSEEMWESIDKAEDWDKSGNTFDTPDNYTIHYDVAFDVFSGSCGKNVTWTYYGEFERLVLSGTGATDNWASQLDIPWYEYKAVIEEVEIEEGITYICKSAFSGCSELVSVTLPESLAIIGDYAFASCRNLVNIYYNGSESTWEIVKKGENWDLSAGAFTSNKTYTFHYGDGLIRPTASGECGKNAKWEYYGDDGLLKITGQGNMEDFSVPHMVPWNQYRGVIKEIRIEKGITHVGSYAFSNCTSITSVIIPKGCLSIGTNAFNNCSYLVSVTLPESLTHIYERAFSLCNKLRDIYYEGSEDMWKSITKMYSWDLGIYYTLHCNTIIEEPSYSGSCGVKAYWEFDETKKLLKITGEGTTYDWTSSAETPWYKYIEKIQRVEIGEGVTRLGNNAFNNAVNITRVNIPESLTGFGNYVFASCYNLANIYYGGSEDMWKSVTKGTSWDKGTSYKINYAKENEEVEYSGSCGANANWDFEMDKGILKITGTGATFDWKSSADTPWYKHIENIEMVEIGEGITRLGNNAFNNAVNITGVNIPESLTGFGNYVFASCYNLADIYYGGSEDMWKSVTKGTSWDKGTSYKIHFAKVDEEPSLSNACGVSANWEFEKDKGILKITGTGATFDWKSSADTPWYKHIENIEMVDIGEGITRLGNNAFNDDYEFLTSITKVTLPESLMGIGDYAFYNCYLLEDIYYGGSEDMWKSVTKGKDWDMDVFYTMHYAKENEEIAYSGECGANAVWDFDETKNRLRITGVGATYDWKSPADTPWNKHMEKIQRVEIREGITRLGNNAFNNAVNITRVNIPESLMGIGDYAFYNCYLLEDIYYGGSENVWEYVTKGIDWDMDVLYTMHYAKENEEIAYSGSSGSETYWEFDEHGKFLKITGVGATDDWESISKTPWYMFIGQIEDVVIEEGITHLGNNAFYDGININRVMLPESLMSIGDYAFYGCTQLRDMFYNGSEETWENITKGTSWDPNTDYILNFAISNKITTILLDEEKVTVTLEEGIAAKLIVASYDKNRLIDVKSIPIAADGEFYLGKDGLNLRFKSGNTVKAFLWWDDGISLTPWCKEEVVTVNYSSYVEGTTVLLDEEKVTVTLEEGIAAKLIVASYDKNRLIDVKGIPTVADGEYYLGKDGLNLRFEPGNTVKAFLWWDDGMSLTPWCKEEVVTVNYSSHVEGTAFP